MDIYPSDRVLPYVYRLTNRHTNEYYIGYREANSKPSHEDIFAYQTSSNRIRDIGFINFDVEIVAEFFDGDAAYDFEQELIAVSFSDPLILNEHFFLNGRSRFKTPKKHRPETIEKMRQKATGRVLSEETGFKIGNANRKRKGEKRSPDAGENISKGKSLQHWKIILPDATEKIIQNLSEFCRENGLQHSHMLATAKGRRKHHKGFRCEKITDPQTTSCTQPR